MMIFALDIESDSKKMQSLSAVIEALSRVQDELKREIKRGNDKRSCHGRVVDGSNNEVGEWDLILDQ